MDLPFLADGVGIVSIALGCFGIAEITKNLDAREERSPFNGKINLIPTWPEFKRIIPSALRGSAIGSFLGILPGGGPTIAQFAAYAVDKKVSKYKHEIGTGCIEGVAGQAAADEAAARTSFIPLMSIGIPENAVMALMMAAFIIKGIQPGPNMIAGHPDLFWGLVASMWVGNVLPARAERAAGALLAVGVQDPLQRAVPVDPVLLLHRHLQRQQQPGRHLHHRRLRLLGYMFMRLELDAAPLMLGFILGPMLEENFRRALLLSRGSFTIVLHPPDQRHLAGLIGVFVALAGGRVLPAGPEEERPAAAGGIAQRLSAPRRAPTGRGARSPAPAPGTAGPSCCAPPSG